MIRFNIISFWQLMLLYFTIAFGQEIDTKSQAEITKFHVKAKVQMRYAITDVETKVRNNNNETSNVYFNMYIPKEAFVSNFSMEIKDKTYVAKVDTKENAMKIFENSTSTSGVVQSFNDPKFKDGKYVSHQFPSFYLKNANRPKD